MTKATVLQHVGDWGTLRTVIDSLPTIADEESATIHTDSELLQYQAAWRTGAPLSSLYSSIQVCVTSPDSTKEHRLEAAITGLALSDNDRREDLAESVYSAISPYLSFSGATEAEELAVAVIYHAAFGSLDEAGTLARRLRVIASRQMSVVRQVRGLSIAGTALRETGHRAEASEAFSVAYSVSKHAGMRSAAANAANSMAALLIHGGRQSEARAWLDAAESNGKGAVDATVTGNLLGLQLRLKLQERRYDELEEMTRSYCALATTTRLSCLSSIMAARVQMRLLRNTDIELVRSLERLHLQLGASSSSDLSAIALVEAWRSLHMNDRAQQLIESHASTRRTRDQLPHEILYPWSPLE